MANNTPTVQLRIIRAKNLMAMDSNGFSDPYVKITLEGPSSTLKKEDKIFKTRTIKKNLNPEWDETKIFKIENPESNFFKVDLYDHDMIGKDFLGQTILTLDDLECNAEKEQWYRLSNAKQGEVLIAIKPLNFSTRRQYVQQNQSFFPNPYQPVPLAAPVWIDPSSYYPAPQSQFPSAPVYHQNNSPVPSQPLQYSQNVSMPGDSKSQLDSNSQALGFNIKYSEVQFDKKIGVGGFGEVWKGEWAGCPVAIKKILKHDISEADLQDFSKEIMLMSKLRHPNIVQFLGACVEPFCLLTEFMEKGCLFNILEDKAIPMDWDLKLRIITDVAKGMVYLHTRSPPIIHRDIKSLNVLVSGDWKSTIADFGLTKIKDRAMLQTKCGSPAWSAPEVLRGEPYNEKADVFSFGIVMWEIMTREHPYMGISPQQLIGLIGYQLPGLRPPIPHDCPSPVLVDLMVRCWDNNPAVRPDFTSILEQLKNVTFSK